MAKTIVVLGATGTQGGSVATTFSKLPGWQVRGVTRNPDSTAAQDLARLGIKIVKASLDDVESLKTAFAGASAIFGVTDFWQFMQSPRTQEIAASKGITWNEACYLQELQQGKNLIDAVAQVATEGPLERFVLSTLSGAKRASRGKYTWVYHFDTKAEFVNYLKEKAREDPKYRALLDKTSYVQIGYYLDNWNKNPIFKPQKNEEGTVVFRTISPPPSSGTKLHPTPFVHPPTDTGPFVETLVLKQPSGVTLLGTSEVMQYEEYVKLWGSINGVKTSLQSLSLDEVDGIFSGGFGREVGETAYYVQEYDWDGGEGAILPTEAGVDLSALTNVASYIRATDWSSVLG